MKYKVGQKCVYQQLLGGDNNISFNGRVGIITQYIEDTSQYCNPTEPHCLVRFDGNENETVCHETNLTSVEETRFDPPLFFPVASADLIREFENYKPYPADYLEQFAGISELFKQPKGD